MIEFTAKVLATNPLTIEVPAGMRKAVAYEAAKGWATVKLSRPRRPRTTGWHSQSHHLNGHIQQICVETGNDFDAVKSVVKMRAISRGYPFHTFQGIAIPQSEAQSSVEECALLIDEVHQLAAELGISLREE